MKYLMHESMIVNGFLDELHSIVYEGDINTENRLLTLVDSDAIEKARDAVSFG
jgi:DNA polymerase III gamma/tau subunit